MNDRFKYVAAESTDNVMPPGFHANYVGMTKEAREFLSKMTRVSDLSAPNTHITVNGEVLEFGEWQNEFEERFRETIDCIRGGKHNNANIFTCIKRDNEKLFQWKQSKINDKYGHPTHLDYETGMYDPNNAEW